MNYANGTRNVDWLTKIKLEGISIFAKVSSENANLKYQRKKLCMCSAIHWCGYWTEFYASHVYNM